MSKITELEQMILSVLSPFTRLSTSDICSRLVFRYRLKLIELKMIPDYWTVKTEMEQFTFAYSYYNYLNYCEEKIHDKVLKILKQLEKKGLVKKDYERRGRYLIAYWVKS